MQHCRTGFSRQCGNFERAICCNRVAAVRGTHDSLHLYSHRHHHHHGHNNDVRQSIPTWTRTKVTWSGAVGPFLVGGCLWHLSRARGAGIFQPHASLLLNHSERALRSGTALVIAWADNRAPLGGSFRHVQDQLWRGRAGLQ